MCVKTYRVFCNVEAYVSCRGYDGILTSARGNPVNQGGTADLYSSLTEARISVRGVFLLLRQRYRQSPSGKNRAKETEP